MQKKLVRLATSDDISETTRIAAQTILIRSIFIHKSIQEELYRIAISRAFSLAIRKASWNILVNKGSIIYRAAKRSMKFYPECRLAFKELFSFQ